MYCTSYCQTVIFENHYRGVNMYAGIETPVAEVQERERFSWCMKTCMFSAERKLVRKEDNAEN